MKMKDTKKTEERKQQIRWAARTLLLREGIEQCSIRKIAAEMNQTGGIIYHYYPNKEAILSDLVMEGYQRIVFAIQAAQEESQEPIKQLSNCLKAWITAMLQDPMMTHLLLSSSNQAIQDKTKILPVGIREQRSSIQSLCFVLEAGVRQGCFQIEDIELTAQLIWCSGYGLIERLIVEQPDLKQKERLIEGLLTMILNSLRRK